MSRNRSAETTIAGYLYQFDNTILKILNSDESESIIIEGVEDIDIENPEKTKNVFQLKYYSGTDYSHSNISEPIQQMLKHFKMVEKGEQLPVNYYLIAHFKSNTNKLKVDSDNKLCQQDDGISALDYLKTKLLTYNPTAGNSICFWKSQDIDDIDLDDVQLERFINYLTININADDIDKQYINLQQCFVEKVANCKDIKDAEEFYYNNALKVVFHKAKTKCNKGILLEDENKEKQKEIQRIKAKIKNRSENIKISGDKYEAIQSEIDNFNTQIDDLNKDINTNQKQAQIFHFEKRKITKAEFLKEIDRKAFLFNKWFAWHKGKEKYLDFVESKLKGANDLARTKNKYLFIDRAFLQNTTEEIKIIDVIENIIHGSFLLNNALATKDKVWSVILDIDKAEMTKIKGEIIEKGFKFNDGGEEYNKFMVKKFVDEPILYSDNNLIIEKAEFQIRIIRQDTFKKYFPDLENEIDVFLYFSGEPFTDKIGTISSNLRLYVIEPNKGIDNLECVNQIFATRKIENDYFRIITVSPNLLQIEVTKPNVFRHKNERFTLGSYVKISDEFDVSVIGILKNYKIKDVNEEHSKVNLLKKQPSFILDIQPVGYLKEGEFKKGGNTITIPPSEVEIVNNSLLKKIFEHSLKNRTFSFGSIPEYIVASKEKIRVELNGDKFFNKHIAVVGSTGSGKSCTVAKILQEGIEPTSNQISRGVLNRSKIIIFDLHGEYYNTFQEKCRRLTVTDLKLPFWLMNSEELEDFFLDSEGSDHNQKSILKKAITWNKKKYNKNPDDSYSERVTYDSPVYFSIKEVLQAIKNYNNAKEDGGIIKFITLSGSTIEIGEDINEHLFEKLSPIPGGRQVSSFNGKFTGFISRLENIISGDDRYNFVLNQGNDYNLPLQDIIKQIIGYEVSISNKNYLKTNVTLIDLSGIPYEIISMTVAILSRLIFNFAFHWKKNNSNSEVETPFLIVYEEAHNYIPKIGEAKYKTVRNAVERIAKEGRKYGVSAMIVSQRPSEISETIFSQCNSFVVMRLTNPHDQQYIKKLLPDDIGSITDNLSAFDQRHALILGDAVTMPAIIEVDELDKNRLPKSNDVDFIQTWRKDWYEMTEFEIIVDSIMNK